ncbi:hypothetical protein GO491_02295 [Flavobacteriaceae bacterium Ap0902]|nr:hypothetical protein [Flavobacteriaceae bacterium Ap0902]
MEIKKTEKASLKGNNILYFLAGLNVVLLVVLGLFSYQKQEAAPVVVEAPEVVETTEAVLIEIPEPETPPPPPPPADEPPPPPPPEVPMEIEETPEPVPPPPIKDQNDITPPDIPTGPVNTGPVRKVDLSALQTKTQEAPKEERVKEPVTVNRVADMAVYPGCEKFRGNKRELIKCFGQELQGDILRYLDTEYPDTDKSQVAVQLEFHVTPDGYITNIVPKRGDDVFKPQAKEALERAADYLRRKGRKIEPAKMADGTNATLIFNNSVVLQNPN